MSQGNDGFTTRKAAVELLTAVLKNKRPLDEAMGRYGSSGSLQNLSSRDRAFARAIAATALRRKGQIEDLISRFIEKPLPKKCGLLKEILLSAVAQLVFLETPAHAAIDIAVRQCKKDRVTMRFSKLANAVLRRVSEQGVEIVLTQDEVRLNTPDWLWSSWEHTYGMQEAANIAAAHLVEAPLDLTVKSDPTGWAQRLGGFELPNGGVRLVHRGRIEDIEGYHDGEWWVQDMAASLAALLAGNVQGLDVADLCAAPGGKTAQLANAGANVTAVDISPSRLDRLKENMQRLKFNVSTIEANILKWQPRQQFDLVLLDAPCSATGTIRRHPDLPYLKSHEDIKELAKLQSEIFVRAADMLKSGGSLIYCTCSLQPEEGIDQVTHFLQNYPGMRLDPIRQSEVFDYLSWMNNGCVRTLPHQLPAEELAYSGMDGFFIARLRKA